MSIRASFALVLAVAGFGGCLTPTAEFSVDGGTGGGPDAGPPIDLSKFTGAPWTVTMTVYGMCGDGFHTTTLAPAMITFVAIGPGQIQFTGPEGVSDCTLAFTVSGNVGTLSNGPVTCTSTVAGDTYQDHVETYTATTADGHNLTLHGTLQTQSVSLGTCNFSVDSPGTR